MEKITLLLILVLLTGAVNESAAKNLCGGTKDGEEGTNGVYYWTCEGGAIKSVGCEQHDFRIIMEPMDKPSQITFDTRMSMKCVPKGSDVECQFPGSPYVHKLKTVVVYAGNKWVCEERGFVANPKRPYSTATDMCQYNNTGVYLLGSKRTVYTTLYTLKPGNCGYFEDSKKVVTATFVIECIADEQKSTVPKETRLREVSKGESVAHCEQWSLYRKNQ